MTAVGTTSTDTGDRVHFRQTTGFLLRQIQQDQSRALDFQQSHNVTAPQMSVLGSIVSHPGLDQRTVGTITSIDRSTVAEVVNRLVDRGLVIARRNRADKRRDSLEAAPQAIEIVYDATLTLIERNKAILSPLSTTDREDLIRQLKMVSRGGSGEPPQYQVPSPDGIRPPLKVEWGLGRLLRASLRRYYRLWNDSIGSITPIQWLALSALEDEDDLDQRTLGAVISLDKASLTAMLDRLARRELLQKRADEMDRRRRLLTLTDAGRSLAREMQGAVKAVESGFLGPLPPQERPVFRRRLTTVAQRTDA